MVLRKGTGHWEKTRFRIRERERFFTDSTEKGLGNEREDTTGLGIGIGVNRLIHEQNKHFKHARSEAAKLLVV